MTVETRPPQLWEYIASFIAAGIATSATIAAVSPAELAMVVERVDGAPPWLGVLAGVSDIAWYGALVIVALLLYWLGARLARRRGTVALFVAPVALIALRYALPWVLYAPIRELLPSSGM